MSTLAKLWWSTWRWPPWPRARRRRQRGHDPVVGGRVNYNDWSATNPLTNALAPTRPHACFGSVLYYLSI
jgi:hypothetical protein